MTCLNTVESERCFFLTIKINKKLIIKCSMLCNVHFSVCQSNVQTSEWSTDRTTNVSCVGPTNRELNRLFSKKLMWRISTATVEGSKH